MEMLNNCFRVWNKFRYNSRIKFVVFYQLSVIRVSRELITWLNWSFSELVFMFSWKWFLICLRINFFTIVQMICIIKPDFMDRLLTWNFITRASCNKHIHIMIISKIIIRNRKSHAWASTFFLSLWIRKWKSYLILVSSYV